MGLERIHVQMEWDVHLPANKRTLSEPLRRKRISKLLQLQGNRMRQLMMVLTSHGNFGSHCKVMSRRVNDTFKKCHLGVEQREHILEICPVYYRLRQDILLSCIGRLNHLVLTHKLNRLARFLDESGRLSQLQNTHWGH